MELRMKKAVTLLLITSTLLGCEGIAITQSNEGGRLKTQSIELINTEEIQAKAIQDCQARGMTFNRIEKTDIGQVTDNTLLGYTYFNYYCDSLVATKSPKIDSDNPPPQYAEHLKGGKLKIKTSPYKDGGGYDPKQDVPDGGGYVPEKPSPTRGVQKSLSSSNASQTLPVQTSQESEASFAKKDDAICKSYGAKKGTQAYIQCRVSLVVSRQEAADRQKTMDALEKKIETLQSQIQSQAVAQSQAQERDRRLSAEQYASEQEFKNKQIELQQAQLQTLQQEAQSAREARKWQNIQKSLDAMGTVTPAAPSPFSSYRIDGRTYRCTDIGGQVNCR
jgi:hypothetical protein